MRGTKSIGEDGIVASIPHPTATIPADHRIRTIQAVVAAIRTPVAAILTAAIAQIVKGMQSATGMHSMIATCSSHVVSVRAGVDCLPIGNVDTTAIDTIVTVATTAREGARDIIGETITSDIVTIIGIGTEDVVRTETRSLTDGGSTASTAIVEIDTTSKLGDGTPRRQGVQSGADMETGIVVREKQGGKEKRIRGTEGVEVMGMPLRRSGCRAFGHR